jgi:hypothetical protein
VSGEDIPFVYEVTLDRSTAKRMARAVLGWAFSRTQSRIFFALLTVAMVGLIYLGYEDDGLAPGSRLFGSIFWAVAFTLVVAFVLAALIYFGNRRNLARSARPGGVMRTGFGSDEFVTSNDLSSSRFSYRAVRSVDLYDGFVLIRYIGQPAVRVYPSALFPAGALERVRQAAEHG